jgi:hypothetical protein
MPRLVATGAPGDLDVRPLPVQLTVHPAASGRRSRNRHPSDAAPAARAFLTGVPALISPNAATRTARRGRWCVARKPQFAHTH